MGLVAADFGPLASCQNFVVASLCVGVNLPRFSVTVDGIIQPIVFARTNGQVYRIVWSNARWKPPDSDVPKGTTCRTHGAARLQKNAIHPGTIILFILACLWRLNSRSFVIRT